MRPPAFPLLLLLGCSGTPPPSGPPNIVLISMDTVRADRLGTIGEPRGLTPNLDRFAQSSTVFTEAWAVANTTAMSHASVFTSRYPSELGQPGPRFTMGTVATTLAEVLDAYGYDTAAFTGGLHLSPGWGLARGFTEFSSTSPLGSFWHTMPAAASWLAARTSEKPYFLFVHGYDAHAPYLDPAPYGTAWTDPEYKGQAVTAVRRRIGTELVFDGRIYRDDDMLGFLWNLGRARPRDARGRAALRVAAADPTHPSDEFTAEDATYTARVYDGAVAYADSLFGWFWQQIAPLPAMRNTVVIVMADHGEALGEDGRFGHGDALSDEELHVPLLIHTPGGKARAVSAWVTLLDVLPTVLDYAGAKLPADARGVSLRDWVDTGAGADQSLVYSEGILREVSVCNHAKRLTFSGLSANSPWLVPFADAARNEDPAWSVDTTVTDPTERAALREAMLTWRRNTPVLDFGAIVDPRLVQEAKEHGYFSP